MTKRKRKLKPRERARQDQATAALRNRGATDPRTAVMTMAYAEPGTQCAWCDCPDTPDSPHYQPGYVCPGCPEGAEFVLHRMHGTPEQVNVPVCGRHRDSLIEATAAWAQQMLGDLPAELSQYSVLDEDQPRTAGGTA